MATDHRPIKPPPSCTCLNQPTTYSICGLAAPSSFLQHAMPGIDRGVLCCAVLSFMPCSQVSCDAACCCHIQASVWSEFERNTANTIVEHGRVPSPLLHQRLKVDPSTCIYRGPCGELTGSAVLTGLEVTSLAELREGWSWIPQHSVKLVCTINPRQAISCPPAAT